MAGFGQKLRQERESRNFTLAQVAEATRISTRYLEALESDDLGALPGSVFNKGYVRSVAQFIGADPDALIRAYVAEEERQERDGRISRPDVMAVLAEAAERNPRRRPATPATRRIPVLSVLAIVLLALGAWSLIRRGGPAEEDGPAPVSTSVESPADSPESAAPSGSDDRAPGGEAATPSGQPAPAGDEPVESGPQPTAGPREAAAETVTAPRTEPVARPAQPTPPASDEPRPRSPEPGEDPPTPPAPSTPAAASEVSINDFGVGTGVVDRRLVGRNDRFDPGTLVWFWNRVIGGRKGERIHHVWIHEGKTISSVELTLGGHHWRTQSRKTLRAPGRWAVEARDAQDRVLARTEFTCAEPS